MKVYLLIGHRKERYPGQHAPEFLEVADEYTMDENPEWLKNKYDEYKKSISFASLAIIETTIQTVQLMACLYPKNEVTNEGITDKLH